MDKDIKYPINEIFYSIQGEGFHAGKPAVFIRFASCNLNCFWCDTDHSEKMRLTPNEILIRIQELDPELDAPLIVLTGGEPTIHNLIPLLKTLEMKVPYVIALETNGTNFKHIIECNGLIDWVTFSPKRYQDIKQTEIYHRVSEVKIVLDDYGELASSMEIKGIFKRFFEQGRMFIQPCSENYQPAIDYVLTHPQWRLSVQIQKIIDVR
jgi:7-carboxy-7-deazaguanine synthase